MIRYSKLLLYITLAFLAVWQLPWAYAFLTTKSAPNKFIMYSSLLNDFIITDYNKDNGIIRHDLAGNTYTDHQVDSLLPTFYMRQLVADECFPDSLFGEPVSPKDIQQTSFNFRMRPSTINSPQVGLYFLLESMSKRVELEMPDDAFRFNKHGIEFINMNTNQIDKEKSTKYTMLLQKKGFQFPPVQISGNPTTMKEYDNGYLLLDAKHQLFHMKQTSGQPYVKNILLPDSLRAVHVFLTEFRSKQTLGFLVDKHNRFYVIESNGTIAQTGIPTYDPTKDNISIFGNKFDWTVVIDSPDTTHYYGIKASDYSLLKTYNAPSNTQRAIGLRFTSPYDQYVKPRL